MIVRLDRGLGGHRYRAVIARAGVLDYGDHRELVPLATLADAASVRSIVGLPLVAWAHTDVAGGQLAPPFERVVGHVLEASIVGDELVAVLEITDAATRAAVDAGELTELSPAYRAILEPAEGTTPEGQRYDEVQRRRDYSGAHVALLPPGDGRCGGLCCVRGRADARRSTMTMTRLDALRVANRDAHASWDRGEGFTIRRDAKVTVTFETDEPGEPEPKAKPPEDLGEDGVDEDGASDGDHTDGLSPLARVRARNARYAAEMDAGLGFAIAAAKG